jgi:hypothetical protein
MTHCPDCGRTIAEEPDGAIMACGRRVLPRVHGDWRSPEDIAMLCHAAGVRRAASYKESQR